MNKNCPTESLHTVEVNYSHSKVSIIIPAFNEAECIAQVLCDIKDLQDDDYQQAFHELEVIVVDNGSTDDTKEIATICGATVISEPERGYGQACWTGVKASSGDILLFVDADGSANIEDAKCLINAIHNGANLAIGVRINPEPGAMSLPQKFGNALACALIRGLWKAPVNDLGPFRAITRTFFNALQMQDRSFGWTVEMQVKANRQRVAVSNIPVIWRARVGGQSKISGTIKGVVLAGIGILKMITALWWKDRQQHLHAPLKTVNIHSNNLLIPMAPAQSREQCPIDYSKEI